MLLHFAAAVLRRANYDRAAVLDWRLHNDTAEGPLPWLPAIPPALGEQPEWGMYLDARAAHRVTNLASQVRHDATATGTTTRPIDADLRGDIAVEDSRASTWRTVLPESLRADPFVENLERRLSTLDRTGVDPVRLIAGALAQPQPLPVEHPAGALWWRIVRRVDPTALRGACSSAPAPGAPRTKPLNSFSSRRGGPLRMAA